LECGGGLLRRFGFSLLFLGVTAVEKQRETDQIVLSGTWSVIS
jgi:hypothetical protein